MLDGYPVIDCHGHMSSPPEFRGQMAQLIALRTPMGQMHFDDDRWRGPLERHIRVMDERNIDVQLLSPRPVAMMHWERPHLVRAWTETTNRAIEYICGRYPERYAGIAMLPQSSTETTERCADLLEEWVTGHGFVGGLLNPDPGADRSTPGMNESYWFPLYERSEALNAPLIVHPSITRDPRVDILSHSYQYNNVTEEYLALLLLQESDVFARFPNLRIVICHCGGAIDRFVTNGESSGQAGGGGSSTGRTESEDAGHSHLDVSENLFVDSCLYDPWLLTAGIKKFGTDRVLLGTEAPGSGTSVLNPLTNKPSDDLVALLCALEFLSDEDRKKLAHDNAMKVFPLLKQGKTLAAK